MRIRHKIPSVFNLYMVDVLCCALGCVILVWQLDLDKTAKTKAELNTTIQASQARADDLELLRAALAKDLANSEKKATDLELLRAALARDLANSEKKAIDLELLRAALAKDLAASEKKATDLELLRAALAKDLTTSEKKASDVELLRAALAKKASDLDERITDADKKLLEQAKKLTSAEKDLKALAELVPGLSAQLMTAQLRLAEQTKETDVRGVKLTETNRSLEELKAGKAAAELALKRKTDELALALGFEAKWKSAEEKLSLLEKVVANTKSSLATVDRDVIALRGEKRTLESEVLRIRQAADNRFAGITLTGRRIVFLVDMSGSMDYVDEKTKSPTKWAEVRETLLKVMKSLPDLEKYQVIIFSERAAFLLGKPDEWIDYDAKTSLSRVEKAMTALKPDGGTNMYAALEAAFRYRPRGLDTIYLFSDGLPNAGEGVPFAEAKRLLDMNREPELSDRLAKHIRMTLKTNWNREILKERVRINAIGFFYESPDVGAFLWAMSRENDGSFVGMSKP